MFRGLSALSLDGKGRMVMPTRYRQKLMELSGGQLVATMEREPCVLIYPLPAWEQFERELVGRPNMDEYTRKMQRQLMAHASDIEMDANGRVLLPPILREYAKLDKSVMLIGQGRRLEIWDEKAWAAERESWLLQDPSKMPEELRSLSL